MPWNTRKSIAFFLCSRLFVQFVNFNYLNETDIWDLREFQCIKGWPSGIKYQNSNTNICLLKSYKTLGGEEYGNELIFTDLDQERTQML